MAIAGWLAGSDFYHSFVVIRFGIGEKDKENQQTNALVCVYVEHTCASKITGITLIRSNWTSSSNAKCRHDGDLVLFMEN